MGVKLFITNKTTNLIGIQMITVAYDPQIFLMQRHGGISRYFVELIKEFKSNPDLGINPVLMNPNVINEYAISDLWEFGVNDCSGLLQPWRELFLSLTARKKSPEWDVVHHTFYQKNFFKKYRSHLQAVTLYDMIPEITNTRGRFGNPHLAKEIYLKNCDLIFSISKSASEDAKLKRIGREIMDFVAELQDAFLKPFD